MKASNAGESLRCFSLPWRRLSRWISPSLAPPGHSSPFSLFMAINWLTCICFLSKDSRLPGLGPRGPCSFCPWRASNTDLHIVGAQCRVPSDSHNQLLLNQAFIPSQVVVEEKPSEPKCLVQSLAPPLVCCMALDNSSHLSEPPYL